MKIDPSEYFSKAHASRASGLSLDEIDSMIRAGLISVLAIPGHKTKVRLADIDRALKFLSAPSIIPEMEEAIA